MLFTSGPSLSLAALLPLFLTSAFAQNANKFTYPSSDGGQSFPQGSVLKVEFSTNYQNPYLALFCSNINNRESPLSTLNTCPCPCPWPCSWPYPHTISPPLFYLSPTKTHPSSHRPRKSSSTLLLPPPRSRTPTQLLPPNPRRRRPTKLRSIVWYRDLLHHEER